MRAHSTMIASLLLLGGTVLAGDWPQFRGPNADGISTEKGFTKDWEKKPPKVLWKVPMGDDGYACPSVAGGKVFIVDHLGDQDIVKAINQKTGKEVWRYAYFESNKPNWGYERATPTVSGGKVYTLSRLGTLNCLNAKNGQLIWTVNFVKDMKGVPPFRWDYSAAPVVDGKKLIVVTGVAGKPVAALDKDTGKPIWEGGATDVASHSTPVITTISGKKQYVIFLGTTLQGLDPETGAAIWSFPWRSGNMCQPLISGSSVFIATQYNVGCALLDVDGSQAKARWTSKEMMAHFNTPILVDGYLYGTGDPGFLMCVELATGKVMWQQPGFEKGGVVGVDGALIAVNGSNGDVTMVEISPTAYKQLGQMKGLGGQSWTPPIVANGKLIVRNKKELACIEVK